TPIVQPPDQRARTDHISVVKFLNTGMVNPYDLEFAPAHGLLDKIHDKIIPYMQLQPIGNVLCDDYLAYRFGTVAEVDRSSVHHNVVNEALIIRGIDTLQQHTRHFIVDIDYASLGGIILQRVYAGNIPYFLNFSRLQRKRSMLI